MQHYRNIYFATLFLKPSQQQQQKQQNQQHLQQSFQIHPQHQPQQRHLHLIKFKSSLFNFIPELHFKCVRRRNCTRRIRIAKNK